MQLTPQHWPPGYASVCPARWVLFEGRAETVLFLTVFWCLGQERLQNRHVE